MTTPPFTTRLVVLASVRRDGMLDAGDLAASAADHGLTAEGVRLCLRRLVLDGTLERVSGRGRSATFRATPDAAGRILPETDLLRFAFRRDAGLEPWDGRWRLLAFTVPESLRHRRDELRSGLRFLGAASVHGGLYVSPNPWEHGVDALVQGLDLEVHVSVATTTDLAVGGRTNPPAIAEALWAPRVQNDLWRSFIGRTEKRLTAARARPESAAPTGVALLLDFAATIEFDPFLPAELNPGPSGATARRAMRDAATELLSLAGTTAPALLETIVALSVDRS